MLSERHSRPQQPFYGVVGRKAAELRIVSDWHEEDFIVSDVDEADQVDFWDPLSTQRQPKERNTHQSVYIFRDENIAIAHVPTRALVTRGLGSAGLRG
jgi:hypothetical protein